MYLVFYTSKFAASLQLTRYHLN